MFFAAGWALSSSIYSFLQRCAPSNIVLHRVHTREGLRWGWLVGLAGVIVYGLMLIIARTIVEDGGPGWVNLFVLIGFWNLVRFAFLIPVSAVRLLRVRHFEKVIARATRAKTAASVAQRVVAR